MPSFWPFKGDDNSAASFEKTLSQLSARINKANAQHDRLRYNKRHGKALLTLYTSFAYIIIALILVLVTGWENWGALEYTAVAGSPPLIYGARTGLDAYYNYRLANSQHSLNKLNTQRDATIERLKAATKYNSTQQLLDKYGGSPQQRRLSPQPSKKRKSEGTGKLRAADTGRTGFAPPPTANIPGRTPPKPVTPSGAPGSDPRLPPGPSLQVQAQEEFAPNAFPVARRPPMVSQLPSQYAVDGPRWYDRIMDVVLGEDESAAKNRIALICQSCRLVNGQAPPGAKSLEDIGRWRCSDCHAWNGVESEAKKILGQISAQAPAIASDDLTATSVVHDDPRDAGRHGVVEHTDRSAGEEVDGRESNGSDADDAVSAEDTPAKSTRSTTRGARKRD